ncbi:MAG: hypothetical protein HY717_20020 [Planctomycetes bacterium]|nr:hypothetical protein [Planctomycetota bacterium]
MKRCWFFVKALLIFLPVGLTGCDTGKEGEPKAGGEGNVPKKETAPAAAPAPAPAPAPTTSPKPPPAAPAAPSNAAPAAAPPAAAPAPGGLQPLAMPADGEYTGVKVEGQAVAKIRIEKEGSVVWVDNDGFKPQSWEQQFLRKGNLPKGYFDARKVDSNGDGDLRDELGDKPGSWKMDEKGNITKG